MFDSLSGKLQNAFRNLRGLGKISEANVGRGAARGAAGLAGSRREFQGGAGFHRARRRQSPSARRSSRASSRDSRSSRSSTTSWWSCSGSANAGSAVERQPELRADGRPARLGQDDLERQAGPAAPQAGPHAAAGGRGRLSPGGDGAARNARASSWSCRSSRTKARPTCSRSRARRWTSPARTTATR